MHPRATTAALGLVAALASTPALAEVTAADAIRIATENGVATVTELDSDDGRWEVEGRDAEGRKIEVYIDPVTGQVLKVERY